MHDLAIFGQANGLCDFILIGQNGSACVLVPESRQEVIEVAREQGRGIGRQMGGRVAIADNLDAMAHHQLVDL